MHRGISLCAISLTCLKKRVLQCTPGAMIMLGTVQKCELHIPWVQFVFATTQLTCVMQLEARLLNCLDVTA